MFDKKYLIIIGVILCLLVLYYFYDEISNIKKLFLPTYEKTMFLEDKVNELENKINKKCESKRLESPIMSITYQSDMVKNGNLSVKYADLSETEAQKLKNNIESFNMMAVNKKDFDDKELDQNIIKSISESIQYADIPSENTISDIPLFSANDYSKNKKKDMKNKPKLRYKV